MEQTPRSRSRAARVAILSTPRCGNTWLNKLCSRLFGLEQRAFHRPGDIDWDGLPESCVLQIHWHRTPALRTALWASGFRVVALSRHPLDALISLLHYMFHVLPPDQCLDREGGDERPIIGAMPRSEAFLGYATGPRGRAMLSVSPEWWADPEALRLRYEDLVGDTAGGLRRLAAALKLKPVRPVEEAVADCSLERLRGSQPLAQTQRHFWLGQPGLWRRLFCVEEARRLHDAHAAVFSTLGYSCDPDPSLTPAQADANWIGLIEPERVEDLRETRAVRLELAAARGEREELARQLADARRWGHALESELLGLRREHEELRQRLTGLEALGPFAWSVARRVRHFTLSHPRLTRLGRLLRRAG
jgi:hypothetical protein